MSDKTIDMTVFIERSPEDVFAAWASAEAFASWFAPMDEDVPEVSMEFWVGGRYTIVMRLPDGKVFTTTGVFREIELNQRIVMTWHCDMFPDPETLVEVSFSSSGSGTELRLLHKTFETDETCADHRGGWDECLAQLVVVLTGKAQEPR